MPSKQKSIFDERPVKVQPRKEQAKIEDEFVSLEDSIFARTKKNVVDVQPECFDSDDEDTKYVVHDDEIPFEESIFAKHKKRTVTVSDIIYKDNKVDLEELFNKYQDLYTRDYILNTKRLYMIDANIFDVCCMNLERSRGAKSMNIDTYDLVKKVIKSVCVGVGDIFYSYTNMNKTLLDLVSEMNPDMDTFTMYHIIDKSYAEAIDEFGGKIWLK